MSVRDPNIEMVRTVANALGNLCDDVLFIGGAVVGLLITDPAAPSLRPTTDVDVLVEVATPLDYNRFERELSDRGFTHDTDPGAPICRKVFGDVKIDVMPTDERVLGFANTWARDAMAHQERRDLGEGRHIWLITAPYFVATKLEAFADPDRGAGDLMGSHDIEDIIAVVDGRPTLADEVRASNAPLKKYLATTLGGFGEDLFDAIAAHLPLASGGREEIVRERLEGIIDGVS